jgi:hypothetical protein
MFTLTEVDDILEPVAGARILGTLDTPLQAQYVELVEIETELMDLTDAMRKDVVSKVSNELMEWDGTPDVEWLRKVGDAAAFKDEAAAYNYFELVARWHEANSAFWYSAKLTFKCFNDTCSIRQGFTVVSLGKKFRG